MAALGPGRIFWAVSPGDRGGGKKRPMIVASRRTDFLSTGQLTAVICSTGLDKEVRLETEIPLPYHEDGRHATRLREPTFAVSDWTTTVKLAEIRDEDIGGLIPSGLLREICNRCGIAFPHER